MATPAQIAANRINAQSSTGPRTPDGKAAVAQNRTTHGLTGGFRVLPCEDQDEFDLLLFSYMKEYQPKTPTARFLVTDLAQAQWRIMRADAIEAELLFPGDNPVYSTVADAFRGPDAVTRLERYAQNARRAYHKAQEKLQAIRREEAPPKQMTVVRPQPRAVPPPPNYDSNPIPVAVPPANERKWNDQVVIR